MIVDQDISNKNDLLLTNPFEVSNKNGSNNENGIDIHSVDSLYIYGRSVLLSNFHYIWSYFDDPPVNQLTAAVCTRHGNLLSRTKVAVKRVMEEAATRKLIYFNNSTVNGLCVAIENCLLDGLHRRAISLFEESPSMGLLKKICKDCKEALYIVTKIANFADINSPDSAINNGRFFQDNDTIQKSVHSISLPNTITGFFNKSKPSVMKYLWIKLAMLEKKLLPIIEHIMQHHQHYYDENSIMSSYLSGSLFLELIAGPCFLDFSLVKPSEHIWNDPDAAELLNRHKIHSNNSWPTSTGQNIYRSGIHLTRSIKNRPYLKIQNNTSPLQIQESSKFNNAIVNIFNMNSPQSYGNTNCNNSVAKEYVESLHQNIKHVLLYGKNNVLVQPKEDFREMQGYLSLHLIPGDKLRLNWTPNQLMNYQISQDSDSQNEESLQKDSSIYINKSLQDNFQSLSAKLLQWDSALSIKMENIVYLHCHNNEDQGGKITLVCQDGVQHPPLNFPPGGHILQFLTCLENGLLPSGRLDPQLLKLSDSEKTFPKLNRRQSVDGSINSDCSESSKTKSFITNSILNNFNRSIRRRKEVLVEEEQHTSPDDNDPVFYNNCDFVFKIIYLNKSTSGESSCESSHGASVSVGEWSKDEKGESPLNNEDYSENNTSINTLCLVMKQHILSRAFYGWLQYYRNIKTVKTQFNNLVRPGSVKSDVPCDASEGLTATIWNDYKRNKDMNESEIYRLIYFGGGDDSIRHEVWPRMLCHYSWTEFETSEIDSKTEINYEKSLSQWKALEVIIKHREADSLVENLELMSDNKSTQLTLLKQNELENSVSEKCKNLPGEEKLTKNSTINISKCDLNPSAEFNSSNNSINTAISSESHDKTFKESELISMADNMHRIDKDVDRCDRNHPYFSSHGKHRLKGKGNLKKLRNIMVTWVWEHIDLGYVQGMCDLLAPLLVVLDSESLTHACFTKLMDTMIYNFPQMGSSMDDNLSMMALLLQIIDRNLYDHMCPEGEVTSLYVSYRWFLLDFKRELCYSDVFCVWETIWSARHVASNHFNLFLALSLLQYYRDIILDNNMEYTDIIKFYNEMAEKHHVPRLLYIARELIESIRDILRSH